MSARLAAGALALALFAACPGKPPGPPPPDCTADGDCADGNPCTDDRCSPAGQCTNTANNAACDDGLACTVDDHCFSGKCLGLAQKDCDDENPCTDDVCEEGKDCVHSPHVGSCGDACSTGGTCVEGQCTGEAPVDCDDDNPCTRETCDKKIGCVRVNVSGTCDDGDACTTGDHCVTGQCEGVVRDDDRDGHPSLACGGSDCCDSGAEGGAVGCSPASAAGIHPGALEVSDSIDNDCDSLVDEPDQGCKTANTTLKIDNGLGLTSRAPAMGDMALDLFEVKGGYLQIDEIEGVFWDFDCNTGAGQGSYSALVMADEDGTPGAVLARTAQAPVKRTQPCYDAAGKPINIVQTFPLPTPIGRTHGQRFWVGLRSEDDQTIDYVAPVLDGGTLDSARASSFYRATSGRHEADLLGNWMIHVKGCSSGPVVSVVKAEPDPAVLSAGGTGTLSLGLENSGDVATGPLKIEVDSDSADLSVAPSSIDAAALQPQTTAQVSTLVSLTASASAQGGQSLTITVRDGVRSWRQSVSVFVQAAGCQVQNHEIPVAGAKGAAYVVKAGEEYGQEMTVDAHAFSLGSVEGVFYRSVGAGQSRYRVALYSSSGGRPDVLLRRSAEVAATGSYQVAASFPIAPPLTLRQGDRVWTVLEVLDSSPTSSDQPWFGVLANDGKFAQGSAVDGIRRGSSGEEWTPLYFGLELTPKGCRPADLSVAGASTTPATVKPGASVDLFLTLSNDGALEASDVTATIRSGDADVQVTGATASFGAIAAGAKKQGGPFTLQVAAGASKLQYRLDVEVANGGDRWSGFAPLRLDGARVDLAVESFTTRKIGDDLHYRVEISNRGTVDEWNAFDLEVFPNLAAAPTSTSGGGTVKHVAGLAAGSSWQADWYGRDLAAGTWAAWALIDRIGSVLDSDRTNDLAGPSTQTIAADERFELLDPVQAWSSMPVSYRFVSGNQQSGMASPADRDAVRAGFAAWAGVPQATLSFSEEAEASAGEAGYRNDGKNTITFGDPDGEIPTGVLAQAIININSERRDVGGEQVFRIIDADLVFNDGIAFVGHDAAGQPGCQNAFDLQGVATHEIGHLLGVAHSKVETSAMWWQQPACTQSFATLADSDRCAARFLYGTACP